MKTISFIGSHKNAGKTTVFNFVHKRLHEEAQNSTPICLTSIGINGEDIDSFENKPKPLIPIHKNSLFITSHEHLKNKTGRYDVLYIFSDPVFKKIYVLGRALLNFNIVLEGPNEKQAILSIKKKLRLILKKGYLLIDGSMDRQFLAHPDISDAIYVSMLVSTKKNQQKKVEDLLVSLSIPDVKRKQKRFLEINFKEDRKSILFNENNDILYTSQDIPFLDKDLKQTCLDHRETPCYLYINGALSKTFYAFLSPFRNLTIILDNFTCYQNIFISQHQSNGFRPDLRLFHSPIVKKIFLKQEKNIDSFLLPDNMMACNLFRDNIHEIRT